ncbi:hypothetical protein Rhe02_67420 [Rhizocola hellebori]|uniref:DUF4034 domain-containing protein n=1 Tax=Rhizocola hellebori TaxID=1392758 RepID=A0A8J3QFI8_9ACTN|nr:hypothetical protein [Rhizocola hellebori]GIH08675.1 hypothetical protein Rhe02_67420 [Rhizocola hellebori]
MPFFAERERLPKAAIDPCLGDARLVELSEIVAARDWLSLEFFFEQIDNWDDQAHYAGWVGGLAGIEDWLADIVLRVDQGTLAPLLLASRRISMAWEIRGGPYARYLSAERLLGFHDQLQIAELILSEITDAEPDNAAAWSLSLKTAVGLELGLEETRRRYFRVHAESAHNLTAQFSFFQRLCPKWGGSLDLMHDFAKDAFLSAPAGHQQGELVAWVHLEQAGHLPLARRTWYFRQPHVLAELEAAAERSVLHPQYRHGPTWLVGHNVFALAFHFAGEHARAKEQFKLLGPTVTASPWADFFFDEPEAGFARARRLAQRWG